MAEGKGMSKGCMVALIVAGAILVLIIIGGITCYVFRGDLVKMSVKAIVPKIQEVVSENPPEGVDPEQFNTLVDSFMVRFDADQLADTQYAQVLARFGEAIKDEQITAEEIDSVRAAIFKIYPRLSEKIAPVQDDMIPADSTADALIDSASGM